MAIKEKIVEHFRGVLMINCCLGIKACTHVDGVSYDTVCCATVNKDTLQPQCIPGSRRGASVQHAPILSGWGQWDELLCCNGRFPVCSRGVSGE